jgi:hypothetical protein
MMDCYDALNSSAVSCAAIMSASRIVNIIAVRAAWQIDVPHYQAMPKRYLPAQRSF